MTEDETEIVTALKGLTESNEKIGVKLDSIQHALTKRPTRNEVNYDRHTMVVRIVVIAVWFILVFGQVNIAAVSKCGPGYNANRLINNAIAGKIHSVADLTNGEYNSVPDVCEVIFPTLHDGDDSFPTGWNLVGLAGYSAIVVIGAYAVTRRWNFSDETDPDNQRDDRREDDE